MRSTLILSILLLTLAACKSSQKATAEAATTQTDMANAPLTDTKWYLIEINGQPVDREENIPHLTFTEASSVGGHGGCNSFGGTYEINDNNRLSFGPMYRTEMYCTGRMEVEDALMEVFEKTDSYVIVGNALHLHRAKMAPLAIFKSR